jgi:arginine:pyruvate transaminase
MPRFSNLTERVAGRGAGAWAVHHAALRLRDAGKDVIFLTVGDPDQPPPEPLIEATVSALRARQTGYSPTIGYPALRQAIAARHARRSGQPCGAENVVIVQGTQGGLFASLQCLAGPGDEVIVLEPAYATYEAVVGATGARMVAVPLRPERNFHPDLEKIAAAITPQTRVIWINSPQNPTGAVFTADEITGIATMCREHDLWLLSDEVYEDLAFARPHISAWSLSGMSDRAVVVSSLSKSHAIPAFRLGWIIGPAALTGHLFNLLLCMTYGSPAFIQAGAMAAFEDELPEVASLRADYERRGKLLCGILAAAPGCRVVLPEGGMFVLLDIRDTGLTTTEFALALLDRERVSVLPCDGFGPSVEGHLRIALCVDDAGLEEAAKRIVRFGRQLERDRPRSEKGISDGTALCDG